jgi:hypothetical protein
MTGPIELRVPPAMHRQLMAHLFPGDRDEHGAVVCATLVQTRRGTRLLARDVFLAVDGTDYIPGQRGYRMLTAAFVLDCAMHCEANQLVYLAVHCHGGTDRVGFSPDDLRSHERGYPALLDIVNGPPVGALVYATDAIAGEIWLPDRTRVPLDVTIVPGRPITRLHLQPPPQPPDAGDGYDRQARMFGDRGQAILAGMKVGILGLGGAGSIVNEHLARLGVGHLVAIDPQRIEPSNVPRVVGSRRRDTRPWLTQSWLPPAVRHFGARWRTTKVAIGKRVATEANPGITYQAIAGNIVDPVTAAELTDCDFLFLCADTAQSRLVFNALVHQYLIPGIQMGAKAQVDEVTGELLDLFTITRPVVPGDGCLWCNGLVSPTKLQEEATAADQLARQRYVDDPGLHAPSVITLNAAAASLATNEFLMMAVGLAEGRPVEWIRMLPQTGEVAVEQPRRDPTCRECGPRGRLARGDTMRLPVRHP